MVSSRRTWWWLGLAVVTVGLLLDVSHPPQRIGIDFHTYLAAATVGLHQGWQHIYDQAIVAVAQTQLVPGLRTQPFLSPPTVALLVSPLTLFPYSIAFGVWAAFSLLALAAALAWSGVSSGTSRWIAVIGALAMWWVLYAVRLGQVVPLVAAGVIVAWRLLREDKDIAAGVALSLIFLKPNTAILVPVALLVAGRYRAFAAWLGAGAVLGLIAALMLGGHGMSAYANELRSALPGGADTLTLRGAVGATGVGALALRLLIVGMVVATAFRLRGSGVLVVPVGIVGSLLVSPYLHAADLCLLTAALWIVWEERPAPAWRALLGAAWVLGSQFPFLAGSTTGLNRWPWVELALLLALVVVAWRPRGLTGAADLRTRAPA